MQPSAGDEYSASWVGVDGVTDTSLIQAGTSQDSGAGTTSYFVWYEVLPAAAIEIPHPVAAGDQMDVTVSAVVSGTWNIDVEDLTAPWSFSMNVAYSGPGSSAEWIEEAPTVNGAQATLANFGNVQFSDVSISTAKFERSRGDARGHDEPERSRDRVSGCLRHLGPLGRLVPGHIRDADARRRFPELGARGHLAGEPRW